MIIFEVLMDYVLKKVAHIGGIVHQGVVASQITLLDRLAMLLAEAAEGDH